MVLIINGKNIFKKKIKLNKKNLKKIMNKVKYLKIQMIKYMK